MLQRGLLTIAEQQHQQQQQQLQPPYETSARATATHEINLLKEQENLSNKRSSNREETNEQFRERINCLPIIEMPQIKIEQDVEYMEGIEEEEQEQQQLQEELLTREQQEEIRDETQPMEVEQEELHIKPVPQLLEPTSILKTSLLTGAANTLATLTAAAEQIARMPNESLTKNYPYFKEENKRTYTIEAEEPVSKVATTTTYTSILQTALMSKRPATLNVAAATSSSSSPSAGSAALTTSKTLHVRTPDQVLKTAVTLATLSEIAAQQEQQQLQQQQQQPHILVVPQVQPTLRKMCTLPFKKLNFANVTTSSTTTSSTATCLTNTASSNTTTTTVAAAAATTITNNYLGSNIKTNTNLTNSSSCIINTNNQAASNNREKPTTPTTTTTATFFDTNNLINNVTICSNSNNSNLLTNFHNQTLKIPSIKPQLVTTQTQTEETNSSLATSSSNNYSNSASSLQTASCSGLLRTAVSTNMKMLTQNSLNTSLTNKFPCKTKISSNEQVASLEATNVAETVVGNIVKHVSPNSSSSSSTLTKMNVIKTKTTAPPAATNTLESSNEQPNAVNNTATNVTVVVFETLLPED